MMKILTMGCTLLLAGLLMYGCSAQAKETYGTAQGYGGVLQVAVQMSDGKLRSVRVVSHQETEGIGTIALDQLPQEMVRANSAEVDSISGATRTSEALKEAVRQAMGEVSRPVNTNDNPTPVTAASANPSL